MSRYQMYWQVYFHPVTRSAEVILTKILHRAKSLHEKYYTFKNHPVHFYSLFEEEVTVEDYLKLDETLCITTSKYGRKKKINFKRFMPPFYESKSI